jgi:hypothetical protein
VKPWLALALALMVSGCANSGLRPLDFRPAWACASRSSDKDVDLTVVRTLDAQGKQLDANYQWSVGGFDRGRLALMAMQKIEHGADPPVPPREVLVSWSGFGDRLQQQRLLLVLHPPEEPPNLLDGVAMIPYTSGLIGGVMSWQRVASLAHYSPAAQLSLVDARGRVLRSAPVDLAALHPVLEQTRAALDATSGMSTNFAKKCEPVTEWMRL